MSSAARKPYYNLKDSLITFFERPTRYLKQSNQKESSFEKPYWDGEYPSMHLDIPTPDWPTWNFDSEISVRRKRRNSSTKATGGALPVPRCPGCAVYADSTSDCLREPVEIHSAVYCTNTPQAGTNKVLTTKKSIPELDTSNWTMGSKTVGVPTGVQAGDTVLQVYAQVGAIKQVTIGQWAVLGPSAAVWVDPNVAEHTICGKMIDGAGSVCIACVDVSCDVCDCSNPPAPLALVADSTIDPGGTAIATASGGCEPYSFSVSGVGYSAVSTDLATTITSASGDCGVNYGAYATVTVTDNCAVSVVKKIRNTGGVWAGHGACVASCTGGASCIDAGNCFFEGTKDFIYEENKWTFGANFNCRTGASVCTWISSGNPCGEPNPSICSSPTNCASYFSVGPCACTGTEGLCYLGTLTHYIWGCA